jgi:putative two-component system response regulator
MKKLHDMLRDENNIMKKMQDFLRDQNNFLESEIKSRTLEIIAIQDVTIHAMASLAETRDSDTGNHIRRTQFYVKVLAEKIRNHYRFSSFLNDDKVIEMLFKSAPLHDIGKVGIPDKILLKPGKFEPYEFEIMKTHTTLGRDAILQAERELGIEVPFLKYAKEIAYYHQEKWDGSGYPEGLAGDSIPISARLMSLADVYDALISRRVYKDGMSHEKAVKIIADGKGTHFDPDIVEAFLVLQDEFKTIAARYADSDEDIAKKENYLNISKYE